MWDTENSGMKYFQLKGFYFISSYTFNLQEKGWLMEIITGHQDSL